MICRNQPNCDKISMQCKTIKAVILVFFYFGCLDLLYAQEPSQMLVTFPLQWQFSLPRHTIILTSDQQLIDLQDPDKKINISLGMVKIYKSLRELREEAKNRGCKTVVLAFDNFFRQYRKDAGDERRLLPDSDEYIQKIKTIGQFLAEYDLGLELSLLSPLELGPAFTRFSNEAGSWIHFKTDLRDPDSGIFSVMLWEQLAWSNNKGKFNLSRTGVRAFAYKEKKIAGGAYTVVNPDEIVEITSGIRIEEWAGTESPKDEGFRSKRIRIFHRGDGQLKGYDRVLVLLRYVTPEMDYFSPKAPLFLKQLMKKYYDAGIKLDGLYSDEMHIQQDWNYFSHHDNGQFSLRYLTPHMATEFARRNGAQYQDMEKYMLYFVSGPEIYLNTTRAVRDNQIVMGETPEAVHQTFLFRDRYYKLLTNQVVDLFVSAKRYVEELYQKDLLTRAHATWAQSPTIDQWDVGLLNSNNYKYEYTSNFIWSNTVHQAASACYDYFKWGDYLTGNGTDHPEGGWSDRNYYGSALACSFGILNKYPNAYTGFWGMPAPVRERMRAIVDAYGANASPTIKAITENVHRDVDVLILYPLNLVACNERFGSWMVQYGYANYITAQKLLEMGEVTGEGKIKIADRTFTTLVTLFELLPPPELIKMMRQFIQRGGKVIWSGPPPLIDSNGNKCQDIWEELFAVKYDPEPFLGEIAAGKTVVFHNSLKDIADQIILTDFIVDRIYPVVESTSCEIVAKVDTHVIGTIHPHSKGMACYLGFRPRDDQSASLGIEQRTLFELLHALDVYPATGRFPGINDNTEYLSRNTDYLATRFPNGTTVLARHYRRHKESWPGGFSRDLKQDKKIIKENPLPSDAIELERFRVNGHEISYQGRLIMAFNCDPYGRLIAFEGHDCDRFELDEKIFIFSNQKQKHITWTPVAGSRQIPDQAFFQIFIDAKGEIIIPLITDRKNLELYAEGPIPGSKGDKVPFIYTKGQLKINADAYNTGRWLYLVGSL